MVDELLCGYMARHEFRTEFATPLERSRVDEANGVIYGVSVITSGVKARGHDLEVDHKTLSQMKECAEKMGKVPVKWNHKSGADSVAGYLKNFRIDFDAGDGREKLRADWHLLKSHERYGHAIELAVKMPEGVGLSAAFCGEDDPKPGDKKMQLARCDELISVDLVANPAANPTGMFGRELTGGRIENGENFMANQNNNNEEPTLADVLAAINGLGERLNAVEQFNGNVDAYLSQQAGVEGGDDVSDGLSEDELVGLLSLSEAQISQLLQSGEITQEDAQEILAIQAEAAEAFSEGGEGSDGEGELVGAGVSGEGNGGDAGGEGVSGAGTALAALQNQVRYLSAKIAGKELAEQKDAEETLVTGIAHNITELAAKNAVLETQLEAMRYALRTSGAKALRPAHGAKMFEEAVEAGNKSDFEAIVSDLVAKGKTRAQAVVFAAKSSPDAYAKYLSERGVLSKELGE